MKRLRYIVGGVLFLFMAIQFVPNELPPVSQNNPGDILNSGLVDADVALLLKTSCYSCHSNETVYPWYSYVAPVSWLVKRDVAIGRDELNFSTWADYEPSRMINRLEDIGAEVNEGYMPMPIYTLLHPSAKLNEAQRQKIVLWAEAAMDSVAEMEE
jgi:hypothetical protein